MIWLCPVIEEEIMNKGMNIEGFTIIIKIINGTNLFQVKCINNQPSPPITEYRKNGTVPKS